MNIEFVLTLFDDDIMQNKLKIMNKIEAMFDDSRNYIPDSFFELFEKLPAGHSIKITVEVIENEQRTT